MAGGLSLNASVRSAHVTKFSYPEKSTLGTRTFAVVNTRFASEGASNDNDTMRPLGVILKMMLPSIQAGKPLDD